MTTSLEYIIQTHNIILFDAHCVLCSAWANFMVKNDSQLQFKLASVQSSIGQQILTMYQLPTDHFETMVLVEHGKLYTESTAFIRIIKHLSFPYSTLKYTQFIPKVIRDFGYRRVALNRYRLFGKTEQCYRMTPEIAAHFLTDDMVS
ncbi:DUF393 domain-containing protein [Acinetobacter halotolerans]|uniref:DUF393 domain-containing protein n=1 Tax=Acinetobacter halotolerans TaxID=1752076 RepID=A0A4Q6XH37_9GAMM|nr:DCC1-like thiol-disulfide oxidoreductase family protein [Acinetobacter halotolerans]RZF53065.1 DUF393 domain-containing protein [Acinetobacter halotolerans]